MSVTAEARQEFAAIREAWAANLHRVMAARRKGRNADPYFHDWKMTPIEQMAWSEIRQAGIPLLPQFPALGYLLDFADPLLKVALECDGKEWHERAADLARDTKLADRGWTVYRVTGAECHRLSRFGELAAECYENDYLTNRHCAESLGRYCQSIEGVVDAISLIHYGRRIWLDETWAKNVLSSHCLVVTPREDNAA